MAEQTLDNPSDMITLYCYVNKDTDLVEAIVAYSLFGMNIRQNGDWAILKRTDENLVKYLNSGDYKTFRVDWDKDPVPAADLDPADDNAWEHQLVQAWDKGEKLTSKDILPYSHEINASPAEPRDPEIDSSEE
jgi:hypothetical protein